VGEVTKAEREARLRLFEKAMISKRNEFAAVEGTTCFGYVYDPNHPTNPRSFTFWKDRQTKEQGKGALSSLMLDSREDLPPEHSIHSMGADGGMFKEDSERHYHPAWISTNEASVFAPARQ